MMLAWTRDAHGWIARCGSERQGVVRVAPYLAGWAWIVDMLPGTDEPQMRSGGVHARMDDAQREAEAQVDAWPTPIAGAFRV